jgi:hypothetical protein
MTARLIQVVEPAFDATVLGNLPQVFWTFQW